MTARSASAAPPFAFNALRFGRLTWLGLTLAFVGWALLLGAATAFDIVVAKSPRPLPPSFHGDLVDIAKCIITSGFALAIIGALQTGFGTLNHFFGAVLTRSSQRDTIPTRPAEAPAVRPVASTQAIEGRPYRLFPDGSVEVETIVGTRRFATMTEARDFI